jgi:hypothetical protein
MSGLAVEEVGTTPGFRAALRANRGIAVLVVLVLVIAVVLALAQSSRKRGFLDPQATDPRGSRAVAALLEQQGVTVLRVTDAGAARRALDDAGPDVTLLVAPTAAVSADMAGAVTGATTEHIVLVTPDITALTELAPDVRETGYRESDAELAAACAWDVAVRTGPLSVAGPTYATDRTSAESCWGGGVLDLPSGSGERATTVIAPAAALTNDSLDSSGNAAMVLGALGRSATLVWWLPSPRDPLAFRQGDTVTVTDLVPPWVGWALVQLALAMLVVVWWRARRLGRVVLEPLPVVVRATETVEGRARLYRRGHARTRAADALRTAATARLRTVLALPRSAPLDTVVAAAAARTGRTTTDVAALLTPGGRPQDDASLARLADALDTLENEVRRS